jgi:hypothetical protein
MYGLAPYLGCRPDGKMPLRFVRKGREKPLRHRVFLLSPANLSGKRARLLLDAEADFELAIRLRSRAGLSVGEAFTFMSGLYFRGKLAYAEALAEAPDGCGGVQVITPGRGLLPPDRCITLEELRELATVTVDLGDPRYLSPLLRDARKIGHELGPEDQAVLLGSVATGKYVDPLLEALGDRLFMPAEFVGRGDMSRGGLLLRCVASGQELTYVPIMGAERRGKRPPRLPPLDRSSRSPGDSPGH